MKTSNKRLYAVLPVRNTALYPGIAMPFLVKRPGGVAAIERAAQTEQLIVVVTQRDSDEENPRVQDLYEIGCLARVESSVRGNDEDGSGSEYQLIVRGVSRFRMGPARIANPGAPEAYLETEGDLLPDLMEAARAESERITRDLKKLGREVLELIPTNTDRLHDAIQGAPTGAYLSYLIAANLELPVEDAQALLEERSVQARLKKVYELLQKQKESLLVQQEVSGKISEKIEKAQRDAILREHLKTIREELGDEEEDENEALKLKIANTPMPEEVRKNATQEFKRLEKAGPMSPESNVIRTYLDWICSMPWEEADQAPVDLDFARQVLDEDHAGLEKIKRRIVQHLAVMKLKQKSSGSILCLVGPPGVGKTSLGQSVARALDRKFVRASLGGVRDEAEIRGHRRTYVGAMPGRIVQALKRAGKKNPVFLLDEIDKLNQGFHGDPASALLEVLDPEQNTTFTDHYLDVPFDLSEVFFIATANSLESIPAPLLDRMEVIELPGYTSTEKLDIAKRYLVPKQLESHGLTPDKVEIEDEVLLKLIRSYTREAGVRNLQRLIGSLFRVAAERSFDQASTLRLHGEPVRITADWLDDAIGPERFEDEVSGESLPAGVATGLAWTPHGGEILFIEAQSMPGKGALTLTGQLGDVMKESAQIALSLVRSKLPQLAPSVSFELNDLHIHVPCGSIPKDGPSAGVAILSAVGSLFSGRKVDSKTAMTGEITLRGVVMPVGGIKEKVIAAHRAGIQRILLPKKNAKDLREVPKEVVDAMEFHFVDSAADVLKFALNFTPETPESLRSSSLRRPAVA